jgi:Tfp pilus assembly protein PilO
MLKSLKSRALIGSLESIKVKPSTMLLVFGGVLVLAYLVVAASYVKERQHQSGLRAQAAAGGGTLSGVGGSQQALKDLQDRLAYLEDSLDTLQDGLPTNLDSTAIVQSLLDYANQSHVAIKQMNALPASEVNARKEGETSYTVLRYTLVVEGGLPDMLNFLTIVENGTSQTAAIGDVSVAQGEAPNQMTLGVSFYARSESTANATPAAPGATAAPAAKQSKSN